MLAGFCEYMVRHVKTGKDIFVEATMAVAMVLAAIFFVFFGNLINLRWIGYASAFFSLFFGFRAIAQHRWEYEYTVTDGVMDVDMIVAQHKRKRMITVDCRNCEIIAPSNVGNYSTPYRNLPVLDYSAYESNPLNYFAVFSKSGERVFLLFQPNETMLQMFKTYIPQKMFIE